jgi:hypothetical protein
VSAFGRLQTGRQIVNAPRLPSMLNIALSGGARFIAGFTV